MISIRSRNPFVLPFVLLAVLALLPTLSGVAAQSASSSNYKVVKRITLGGDGGWDYLVVDPDSHRIYISRSTIDCGRC